MTQAALPKPDFEQAWERVRLYAKTLKVTPPVRLICDEGAPAPELMAFCREYGANLDWIFMGDVRGMIRDSFYRAQNQMREADL